MALFFITNSVSPKCNQKVKIFPSFFEPECCKIHANVNIGYFAEYQYDFDIIWRDCITHVLVYNEAKKKWWHHLDLCMDDGQLNALPHCII